MILYPIFKRFREISQGVVTGGLLKVAPLYFIHSIVSPTDTAVTAITRQLYSCGLICTGSTIIVHYNRSNYRHLGDIHTSELDRSEIDLSPKRSECERSNAN